MRPFKGVIYGVFRAIYRGHMGGSIGPFKGVIWGMCIQAL